MTIVMGLDQHRAQITAEWLDTETGEVSRGRVTPADRAGVRRFLERFARPGARGGAGGDDRLAVRGRGAAAVGANGIWPSRRRRARCGGTRSAPRTTGRTPGICASCLMAGRLPESLDRARHLLDLRARVRLRHALVDERGEWQQRIQAVLYHHGLPKRAGLLTRREPRLARASCRCRPRDASRSRSRWRMIDAIDLGRAVRPASCARYARRQTGCRALMGHYGIGALTSGRDPRRARRQSAGSPPRARRSATAAWTSPCTPPTSAARPDTSPAKARPLCAGRCMRPPRPPAASSSPDRDYFLQAAERLGRNRACLALARKLLKRCYHTLKDLGDEALAPA